jgi:hypothetical protein
MNSYNGFSGAQRARAQRWLTEMWGRGILPRPCRCVACGQENGIIDAHTEDYSEPFRAGKTDEWPLCFRCHMMLHCRFSHPDAWARYRAQIAGGMRFAPMVERNFYRFRADHLFGATSVPFTVHEPREDILARIVAGEHMRHVAPASGLRKRRLQQVNLGID